MFIAEYIFDFASQTPGSPAVIHNGNPISYLAFAGAIGRASREFAASVPPAPGTVAIRIHDLADCWVATIALQALGYTTICAASLDVLASLEVGSMRAIVVSTAEGAVPKGADLAPIYAMNKPFYETSSALDVPALAESAGEYGHILYTSGTTGKYKKVFKPGRTQRESDRERRAHQAFDSSTKYHMLGFGLWTAIGFKMPPAVWSCGATVIFEQRPDWAEKMIASGFTNTTLLPDQAMTLSQSDALQEVAEQFTPLPAVSVGGGFTSAKVTKTLARFFRVRSIYGCTELNIGVLFEELETPAAGPWFTSHGTRQVEVENELHERCAANEVGNLRIKLTELDAQSYLGDPETTHAVFRGGYFYPGDLAIRREDGRIRVLGRAADVVNLGGQKIAVAPIEANLQNILQVDYICLFAGVNAAGEPEAVVAMEAPEMPSQDRLDHVGQEFSQWGEVRFALVDRFPRTQSGTSKIDRKRLRMLLFPE
ncbi:MAG: AMP-binding protein [Halieaceae bacterium]|nr:AMP-binding protein [Haliea alexandrii]MCR9185171.1 AMP-binding protein [Halieaceae bacterium]